MASALRALTWIVSAALHAGIALSLVSLGAGETSYEAGDGSDLFAIEHGIALEGLSQIGKPSDTIDSMRETPQEAQAASTPPTPPVEEKPPEEIEPVKETPPELAEKSEVITAKAEEVEEQEILRDTPKEETKPPEVAAAEPVPPVAAREERSVARKQSGGDTSIRQAYLGKVRSRIEAQKVLPKKHALGTVVVRFTVDAKGQIVSREVVSGSGSPALDAAALDAVTRAAPFPSFPSGLSQPHLIVTVPFHFKTR